MASPNFGHQDLIDTVTTSQKTGFPPAGVSEVQPVVTSFPPAGVSEVQPVVTPLNLTNIGRLASSLETQKSLETQPPKTGSLYKQFQQIESDAAKEGGEVEKSRRVTRSKVSPAIFQESSKHREQLTKTLEVSQAEYEVEKILGRRINSTRNLVEYFIHWKNYSHTWDSWVLVSDLNCDELISEFEQKKEATEDNLAHTLQAVGFFAPSSNTVVRYLDTNYFLVPYGGGKITKFCIVGPNKDKTELKCKHTKKLMAHHAGHAKLVAQALKNNLLAPLTLEMVVSKIGQQKHTQSANKSLENSNIEAKSSVSTSKICINLKEDIQENLQNRAHGQFKETLIPEQKPPEFCKCEGGKCKYNSSIHYETAKLYTLSGVNEVKVGCWKCERNKSECTIFYDGQSDGIFNFTNSILVSYEIFLDFIITIICAKSISFHGFVEKMNLTYSWSYNLDPNGNGKFLSKTYWIQCFFSWVKLLHIDENLSFKCILCKDYPAWLCLDGISLGLAKKNIMWGVVDQIPNINVPKKDVTESNYTKPLIGHVQCRKLLLQFTLGEITGSNIWNNLMELLETHCSPVYSLLKQLYQQHRQVFGGRIFSYTFAGIWVDILKVCAAPNGVVFFMHPVVVCILNNFLASGQLTQVYEQALCSLCPILYNLLLGLPNKQLSEQGKAVLQYLADFTVKSCPEIYAFEGKQLVSNILAHAQISNNNNNNTTNNNNNISSTNQIIINQNNNNDNNDNILMDTHVLSNQNLSLNIEKTTTSLMRTHGWKRSDIKEVPTIAEKPLIESGNAWSYTWPKIRELPVYKGLDKERESAIPDFNKEPDLQWCDDEDATVLPDEECVKKEDNTYNSKDLIFGIFVGCCIHRVCYGYHLMLQPEGRKDVMKVLYERLPAEVLDKATILFDFSCQAGVYCCRREPELFAKTKFLVDRFHGYSHKCPSFWKLSNYPDFAQMASTASESLNSELQPLQSMVSYMKQETFMTFLSLFISIKNNLKNKALERAQQNVN